MTIGTLSARILMDASGLKSGMGLTRAEMKLTRAAFEASTTDVEKLERALKTLESARDKGAFRDEQQYARAVAAVRAELDPAAKAARDFAAGKKAAGDAGQDLAGGLKDIATNAANGIPGVGGLTSILQAGHPILIAAAAAAAALAAGYKLARAGLDWYVDGVKQALTSIDDLSKESRILGTSVQGLREMRAALGEIGGLDAGETDKALEKLNRQIGEATSGNKAASETFRALGLDAQQLANVGTDEAMLQVADALGKVTSTTDRARLATELFGKEGQNVSKALMGGRAAIDEAREAARQYAGVITDVDAAQIEATNDAWGRVSAAVASLTEQAAVDLAPALQVAAERVLELLDPQTSSGQTIRTALEAIPPTLTIIIDQTDIVIGQFQLAQAAIVQMANSLVQSAAAADKVIAAMTPGVGESETLQAFAEEYQAETDKITAEAMGRIARGMGGGAGQAVLGLNKPGGFADIASAMTAGLGKPAEEAAAAQVQLEQATQATSRAVRQQHLDVKEAGKAWDALANGPQAADVWGFADVTTAAAIAPPQDLLSDMEQFTKDQDTLAKSVSSVTDNLQQQIDTWGMTADEETLAKLAAQGATQEQLDGVRQLQERIAELKRQKESLRATDVSIAAGGTGDWADMIQRSNEAAPPSFADIKAGFKGAFGISWDAAGNGGAGTPSRREPPDPTPWYERIAKGVEAMVSKEGVVLEEALP